MKRVDDGIFIPGWKKRFSKSAKSRLLAARRAATHRSRSRNGSVTHDRDENVTSALPKEEKRRVKKSNTTPTPSGGDRDDDSKNVLAIYAAYPLKSGRAKATKAIQAALKKVEFAVLLESTKAYAAARTGADGKPVAYTKHPATWFNQECWADDREQWTPRDGDKPAPDDSHLPLRTSKVSTKWEDENWNPINPPRDPNFRYAK